MWIIFNIKQTYKLIINNDLFIVFLVKHKMDTNRQYNNKYGEPT